MIRARRPRLSLLAMLLWCGCGGGATFEADPQPATIAVFPAGPLTVRAGDALALSLTVRDRNGQGLSTHVSFISSAPNVATAAAVPCCSTSSYALTALAPGTAVITAFSGDAVTKLTVNVVTWPRTVVSGPAFGAAARGSVALVTTLDGHVLRLDAASGAVVATYDYYSTYVAFSNDGARAFFANTVFDLATGSEVHALVADPSTTCGQITAAREQPGGTLIFLGCSGGVLTVNGTTSAVISSVAAGPVTSLALHPTDPRLYASVPTDGRVDEISTQSTGLIRELPILGGPQGAVLPGGSEIDVAMEGDHQVERWDLAALEATDSAHVQPLPGGGGPYDLVESTDGTRLLASVGGFVVELDRATITVTKTYWVGGTARRIGVADGRAVVANEGGWIDLLPF